jgi:hypothetical protein
LRRPKKANGAITIASPDGINIKIPLWMVKPRSANYKLSTHKAIGPSALLFLSDLLETITKNKDETLK